MLISDWSIRRVRFRSQPADPNTKAALEESLQRLGLDYVDLYLIHRPLGDYYAEWRAMEKAHADGLARAIGVSNFYPDRLIDLVEHAEVVPAVNQIETHPFFQRHADQDIMHRRGLQMEARGGIARGGNTLFVDPKMVATAWATGD